MKSLYDEVLARGLKVMDLTATALCKENRMPIYVFNMDVEGNLSGRCLRETMWERWYIRITAAMYWSRF